jgi:hypothetical protein
MPFGWPFGRLALSLTALVPLGWYLGSPLFVDRSVSEAPPVLELGSIVTVEPRLVAQGSFGVVDTVHHGQGTASLLNLSDGTRILRLGDFRVTNGPDLYVYLSAQPGARSSAELHDPHAFEVAPLKGNLGDQNYILPADLNLADFESGRDPAPPLRRGFIHSSARLTPDGNNP